MLLFQGKSLLKEAFDAVQQKHFLTMLCLNGSMLVFMKHLNMLMISTFPGWRWLSHGCSACHDSAMVFNKKMQDYDWRMLLCGCVRLLSHCWLVTKHGSKAALLTSHDSEGFRILHELELLSRIQGWWQFSYYSCFLLGVVYSYWSDADVCVVCAAWSCGPANAATTAFANSWWFQTWPCLLLAHFWRQFNSPEVLSLLSNIAPIQLNILAKWENSVTQMPWMHG